MDVVLPNGKYVGAIKDETPLPLEAEVDPPPSGAESYSWSITAGPGNGTFSDPNVSDPEFTGTTRGELTVKVVVTDGSDSCEDTDELVVIEIDDLSEDVPDQIMDQLFLDDADNTHVIPYNASAGDLRAVRIAPTDDPSDPYEWGTDFNGEVDNFSGDVTLTFVKDGVYIIKTIRAAAGAEAEEIFAVWYNTGDGSKKDGDCKDGKHDRQSKPTADLVLISASANDDTNYLVGARNAYGGTHHSIDSVADVIAEMKTYFEAHNSKPFSVLIVDHGTIAYMSMGAGDTSVGGAGKYIDDTATTSVDRDAFMKACKDYKITTCTLAGCCVATNQQGRDFIQTLATGGQCTVRAPNKKIAYQNNGKFSVVKGMIWVTKTPP